MQIIAALFLFVKDFLVFDRFLPGRISVILKLFLQNARVFFIRFIDIIWVCENLRDIGDKSLIIIWMAFPDVRYPLVGDDHLVRCDIRRYAPVFFNVDPANDLHGPFSPSPVIFLSL